MAVVLVISPSSSSSASVAALSTTVAAGFFTFYFLSKLERIFAARVWESAFRWTPAMTWAGNAHLWWIKLFAQH
jgi:hypothetical protein